SNEYFSDGISEELLNLLTKIPQLKVIARTSSFSFKGQNVPIAEIAETLNVAHVLEGSVRKSGNQVRITAQLIRASDSVHLWSESYDRTLDNIFAVQDEIAGAVVDALSLTLLGGAPRVEQIKPEAYALYLQAMYLNAQGNAEAYEQSIALYKQALAIAPDYVAAWQGLVVNYGRQVNDGLLPLVEGYALQAEAINQSLAIDPDSAEAHTSLGYFSMNYDHDLAAAARHFKYALSQEPTNLTVIHGCASLMFRLGRLEEAIALREYRVAHDPLGPVGHTSLAGAYLWAGRPDEAIASSRTALMLAPGRRGAQSMLGMALLLKGETEAALEAIQQAPAEVYRLSGLVRIYHALGRADESDAALSEFIEKYEQERPLIIASMLAYRGEADRAFTWLDK
ncbi:MAG: tetratricopeptide repeat protein, partial [Lysobacterales bacterium]